MNAKIILVITCLAATALLCKGQTNAEASAHKFRISSLQTPFGVQGEFEGTYIIRNDSIEVYVANSKIYVSEHCPYQGRSSINYLTFGLVTSTGTGRRSKIESEAPPVGLGFVMRPREEHSIGLLYFVIPRDRTVDLSKRWLVVKIQTDALDDFSEAPGSGFVFASSSRDIFASGTDTSFRF